MSQGAWPPAATRSPRAPRPEHAACRERDSDTGDRVPPLDWEILGAIEEGNRVGCHGYWGEKTNAISSTDVPVGATFRMQNSYILCLKSFLRRNRSQAFSLSSRPAEMSASTGGAKEETNACRDFLKTIIGR